MTINLDKVIVHHIGVVQKERFPDIQTSMDTEGNITQKLCLGEGRGGSIEGSVIDGDNLYIIDKDLLEKLQNPAREAASVGFFNTIDEYAELFVTLRTKYIGEVIVGGVPGCWGVDGQPPVRTKNLKDFTFLERLRYLFTKELL